MRTILSLEDFNESPAVDTVSDDTVETIEYEVKEDNGNYTAEKSMIELAESLESIDPEDDVNVNSLIEVSRTATHLIVDDPELADYLVPDMPNQSLESFLRNTSERIRSHYGVSKEDIQEESTADVNDIDQEDSTDEAIGELYESIANVLKPKEVTENDDVTLHPQVGEAVVDAVPYTDEGKSNDEGDHEFR